MKIHNTIHYFLDNFEPTEKFLKKYYEMFPAQFNEYFLYHCHNIDEKLKIAIEKLPAKLSSIKEMNEKMAYLIQEVASLYEQKFNIEFTKDVHLIVGAYGSNAYTHRQIIPEMTFCLERLSSKDEHLKVIIAHEFGHALHNILTDKVCADWTTVQWFHPYTWLLQEGCATYFSKQFTIAGEAVYFAYDDSGEGWLKFAKMNKQRILGAFIEDINKLESSEIFREWFSINGGIRFGFTRLGYFIGYCAVLHLVEKYGEIEAVTLWKESYFANEMKRALIEMQHV